MKWFRRFLAALLCPLLLAFPTAAATDVPVWISETESGEKTEGLVWEDSRPWKAVDVAVSEADALKIGGKSSILMDLSTGTVLYEKNSHDHLPIASVTKIMTLLLIMESIDSGTLHYTDVLTCSETAASMGGSQIWLEPGETMTVDDLLKAVCVVSANDACAVFAEHLAGSIESFVVNMNARAAQLGMNDTHFLDCSGLNDEAYSSAYDVALMSRELMTHRGIIPYTTIWMDSLRGGASQLVNTNRLIRHYSGATGLKTGTTAAAGHNLSATASRDGLSLVAVVLGCATTAERFGGTRKLLDYGFANYKTVLPTVPKEQLPDVSVNHGLQPFVPVAVPDMTPVLLKKGTEKELTCSVSLETEVEAPVKTGQKLGEVTVSQNGKVLAAYPLSAAKDVGRRTFFASLSRLFSLLAANG